VESEGPEEKCRAARNHLVRWDWAKRNQPLGPSVVARYLPVRQTVLSDKVRALLTSFPRDKDMKSQLIANLYSGWFVGPFQAGLNEHRPRAEAGLKIHRRRCVAGLRLSLMGWNKS
jgi:hypothetical protein